MDDLSTELCARCLERPPRMPDPDDPDDGFLWHVVDGKHVGYLCQPCFKGEPRPGGRMVNGKFEMPAWERKFWADYDARWAQREWEHRFDLQWQLEKVWDRLYYQDCGCPRWHCYASEGRCGWQV